MGGSGKTPHTEYIVDKLKDEYKIGVLSRGYKRKTRGFVPATPQSHVDDIGDEPYQIYQKFKDDGVMTAVCEKRVKGIEEMRRINSDLNLIVLDDAFQHRYVKPTVSIVITEYSRPVYEDAMLPYGRLREPARGLNRANMVIVGKCPDTLKPADYRAEINHYNVMPWQYLFFSHINYQPLAPVFDDVATSVPYLDWLNEGDSVLAIAGIGNPRPFIKHIKSYQAKVKVDIYPDHHQYTKKDIDHILARYKQLKGWQRIIITTEKDAVRLAANPYYPHELRAVTFYLPVKVEFEYPVQQPTFEEAIEKVIREKMRSRQQ